jgi:hypothetical protein
MRIVLSIVLVLLLVSIGNAQVKDIPTVLIVDEQLRSTVRPILALVDEVNTIFKAEKIKVQLVVKKIDIKYLGGKEENCDTVLAIASTPPIAELAIIFKKGRLYTISSYEEIKDTTMIMINKDQDVNGMAWQNYALVNSLSRNTLLHELGHVFGLGHSMGINRDIMYPFPKRDEYPVIPPAYKTMAEAYR